MAVSIDLSLSSTTLHHTHKIKFPIIGFSIMSQIQSLYLMERCSIGIHYIIKAGSSLQVIRVFCLPAIEICISTKSLEKFPEVPAIQLTVFAAPRVSDIWCGRISYQTNPSSDTGCETINISHHNNLMAFSLKVTLMDTECIVPAERTQQVVRPQQILAKILPPLTYQTCNEFWLSSTE
jgi:hypothetical protein